MNSRIIIIGGGLAGLTAALHLSKIGLKVTVIEKNTFPKHKVCGEYISNEVLPYLNWLDINVEELNAVSINNLIFSNVDGRKIETQLPLGGFGVSRYSLDFYLYRKAIASGCEFIHQNVTNVDFGNDLFEITLADSTKLEAKVVLGAFGKRSNLDVKMGRHFIEKNSPWLAVKSHYQGEINPEVVGLHNFRGGYCGVSMVEDDKINVCYLAKFESFKKYRNIEDYQQNVLSENPLLREVFTFKRLFDAPITIGQISFDKKEAVENHILMIGDTAGLIHPLCGNGMAMAIHSAKLAAECTQKFIESGFAFRSNYEKEYAHLYKTFFASRLQIGRTLGKLLANEKLAEFAMIIATRIPGLVPMIIKKTHGKPIEAPI